MRLREKGPASERASWQGSSLHNHLSTAASRRFIVGGRLALIARIQPCTVRRMG